MGNGPGAACGQQVAIELAEAKLQYLQATANTACIKIIQQVADIERAGRAEILNIAATILNCTGSIDVDVCNNANNTMQSLLNGDRTGININDLLGILERQLPAIGDLAQYNLSANTTANPANSLVANLANDNLPPISPDI
jgi:hypothetical protein